MMSRATLSLVLLVSSAHALVHVYEISLPSVEQNIAAEYYGADAEAGKRLTGGLSNAWRFMWGLGAILAGWLVDRHGSRRMLAIYLLGCAATCVAAATSTSQSGLFSAMILMGIFASIYHPAGLALISHETTAANRPRALGLHGIFGSAGIGLTPLLSGTLLFYEFSWRQIYWMLMLPGALLGGIFVLQAMRHETVPLSPQSGSHSTPSESADWRSFFTLTQLAMLQGFIYAGVLSFLPRYLSRGGLGEADLVESSAGNYLAAGVLLVGCVGQDLAGRFARPERLERQLTLVTFGNVPLLTWMALATGWGRPVAAGLWALVHFMHQPLYNSLIAKYTPRGRRSLSYGFSFAMGLGLGSFGAGFAGISQSDLFVYGTLAGVAAVGGGVGLLLCMFNPRSSSGRSD